jgi:hypothetical protein
MQSAFFCCPRGDGNNGRDNSRVVVDTRVTALRVAPHVHYIGWPRGRRELRWLIQIGGYAGLWLWRMFMNKSRAPGWEWVRVAAGSGRS